jgi:hypothetical protein
VAGLPALRPRPAETYAGGGPGTRIGSGPTNGVRSVDEQDTVAVRPVTPVEKLSEAMGSTYGRIMEYLSSEGIQPSGTPPLSCITAWT